MASKQPTKLETVYDVFWNECKSINLEHDHSVNPLSEAEMKTKETEIGMRFVINLFPRDTSVTKGSITVWLINVGIITFI